MCFPLQSDFFGGENAHKESKNTPKGRFLLKLFTMRTPARDVLICSSFFSRPLLSDPRNEWGQKQLGADAVPCQACPLTHRVSSAQFCSRWMGKDCWRARALRRAGKAGDRQVIVVPSQEARAFPLGLWQLQFH